jgi:hypothetical protein
MTMSDKVTIQYHVFIANYNVSHAAFSTYEEAESFIITEIEANEFISAFEIKKIWTRKRKNDHESNS